MVSSLSNSSQWQDVWDEHAKDEQVGSPICSSWSGHLKTSMRPGWWASAVLKVKDKLKKKDKILTYVRFFPKSYLYFFTHLVFSLCPEALSQIPPLSFVGPTVSSLSFSVWHQPNKTEPSSDRFAWYECQRPWIGLRANCADFRIAFLLLYP